MNFFSWIRSSQLLVQLLITRVLEMEEESLDVFKGLEEKFQPKFNLKSLILNSLLLTLGNMKDIGYPTGAQNFLSGIFVFVRTGKSKSKHPAIVSFFY